jgi:hypothetical protein
MKELIRHILKEETSLPLFVRRRITQQQMRKSFLNALYYVIERFLGKHGFLSLDRFKELVISEMMENIHPYTKQYGVLNDPYEDDETYRMINDSLSKHYSDEIEDNYNTFFGKKDINESEETSIKKKLLNSIDDIGILKTSRKVGGVGNLIKILNLNEQELDNFIYQYLTENYYPDYNWGPELHEFYREDVERHGIYDFVINDNPAYVYLGEWDGYDYLYTLSIGNRVKNELTELFGDKWIPIFKKWFEDNSGLEVRDIDLENKYLVY